MTESTVAIIGSGIAGTTIAYLLANRGIDVTVFEKGPDYPYPHAMQFQEEFVNHYFNPERNLGQAMRKIVQTGNLPFLVDDERVMRVGGMATAWSAITLRMTPNDINTRTLYGRGQDWPITYADLEPYYGRAETHLGVSGTDDDNPFAPPRSTPHPLPPFEFSYVDRIMADRLRDYGIVLHTTSQARTRAPYDGRAGCQNYGACFVCPLGARYSPTHHLMGAVQTGLCTLHTGTSVRRIIVDQTGRARSLLIHDHATGKEYEHSAQVFVLAPGTIEAIRLLLLSSDERAPDGLGNAGGQVGKRVTYHQVRWGLLRYPEKVYPGRMGPFTGQSHQFIDHDQRGEFGGVKIEFADTVPRPVGIADSTFEAMNDLENAADFFLHTRWISLHAETDMTDQKYVELASERDPLGDLVPHVQHQSSEFDQRTYEYSQRLFQQVLEGTQAESGYFSPVDDWVSWSHHMGGARMGNNPDDSVVNEFCQVHGVENLFTAGSSSFVETSAVNPTLTIVALAIRTADYLLDQRLG